MVSAAQLADVLGALVRRCRSAQRAAGGRARARDRAAACCRPGRACPPSASSPRSSASAGRRSWPPTTGSGWPASSAAARAAGRGSRPADRAWPSRTTPTPVERDAPDAAPTAVRGPWAVGPSGRRPPVGLADARRPRTPSSSPSAPCRPGTRRRAKRSTTRCARTCRASARRDPATTRSACRALRSAGRRPPRSASASRPIRTRSSSRAAPSRRSTWSPRSSAGPGDLGGHREPDLHRRHRRLPRDRLPAAADPGRRGRRAGRRAAACSRPADRCASPTSSRPSTTRPAAVMPEARRRDLVRLADELGLRIVEDLTPDCVARRRDAAADRRLRPRRVGSSPSARSASSPGAACASAGSAPRARTSIASSPARSSPTTRASLITQAIAARVFERIDEVAAATTGPPPTRRRDLLT